MQWTQCCKAAAARTSAKQLSSSAAPGQQLLCAHCLLPAAARLPWMLRWAPLLAAHQLAALAAPAPASAAVPARACSSTSHKP